MVKLQPFFRPALNAASSDPFPALPCPEILAFRINSTDSLSPAFLRAELCPSVSDLPLRSMNFASANDARMFFTCDVFVGPTLLRAVIAIPLSDLACSCVVWIPARRAVSLLTAKHDRTLALLAAIKAVIWPSCSMACRDSELLVADFAIAKLTCHYSIVSEFNKN